MPKLMKFRPSSRKLLLWSWKTEIFLRKIRNQLFDLNKQSCHINVGDTVSGCTPRLQSLTTKKIVLHTLDLVVAMRFGLDWHMINISSP